MYQTVSETMNHTSHGITLEAKATSTWQGNVYSNALIKNLSHEGHLAKRDTGSLGP